jgi:hypothetical protein
MVEHLLLEVGEHLLGVDDRVALGEHVALDEDVAVAVHEHGLRGGRAAVQADERLNHLAGSERRLDELRHAVALLERRELVRVLRQARAARGLLLLEAADVDVSAQVLGAAVGADALLLGEAELHGPEGREVLGAVGDADQLLRVDALG